MVVDTFRYYAGAPERLLGDTIPVAGGQAFTVREPVGVVGLITPWNFPLTIAAWKLAPGARGRQHGRPQAGRADAAHRAALRRDRARGRPAGGRCQRRRRPRAHMRAAPGRAPRTWPRSRSPARPRSAGRSPRAQLRRSSASPSSWAASRPTSSSPTPTSRRPPRPRRPRSSATPGRTAARARGSSCRRALLERFLELLEPHVTAMRVGDPLDERPQMGPLISAGQRETVASFLRMARRSPFAAARPAGPGFWFAPTVLAPGRPGDRVAREEVFGPIAAVIPFADERDAVRLANDSIYGLSGSIWTRDGARALRVARAVETGVLSINANTRCASRRPSGASSSPATAASSVRTRSRRTPRSRRSSTQRRNDGHAGRLEGGCASSAAPAAASARASVELLPARGRHGRGRRPARRLARDLALEVDVTDESRFSTCTRACARSTAASTFSSTTPGSRPATTAPCSTLAGGVGAGADFEPAQRVPLLQARHPPPA